jgi:hypothetical protein
MALQQIIQHPTGTYSQYWKISQTNLDYVNQTGTLVILGYVSEQARLDGKVPLDNKTFIISGSDFLQWFAPVSVDPEEINQVKNAYLCIKGLTGGGFEGATDV